MSKEKTNDNTPIQFSDSEKQKIKKIVQELQGQTQFLQYLVEENTVDVSTATTHLQLAQYSIIDLCEITKISLDEIQRKQELTNRIKELVEENKELAKQATSHITPTVFAKTMTSIQNIFRTWYEAIGLHYASLEYSVYGIRADFSEEMGNSKPHLSADKLLFTDFLKRFESLKTNKNFKTAKEPGSSRIRILDTDTNKTILEDVVHKAFPNAHLTKYTSRYDCEQRVLRFEIFVNYEDILNLIEK